MCQRWMTRAQKFAELLEERGRALIDEDKVVAWVRDNYAPEELYGAAKLVEFVQTEFCPEDVFPELELIEWADNNGFTKDTEET